MLAGALLVRARVIRPLAVACALLAAVSCTASQTPTPSATGQPATRDQARFDATLVQQRPDEGTRRIAAELTNRGSSSVTVESVALDSPGFQPLPATSKDTTFAVNQTIDLTMQYGEPRCTGSAANRAAGFTVVLADGSRLKLPLDRAGQAWLDRLHDDECALKRVTDIASLSFGADFSRVVVDGERYLHGELLVRRPADADARGTRRDTLVIDSFAGSVLLHLGAAPDAPRLPVELAPGSDVLRVPILIGSSNRCDSHALGGSTQTFLLSVYVRTPGGGEHRVIMVPDHALQVKTLALIHDICR